MTGRRRRPRNDRGRKDWAGEPSSRRPGLPARSPTVWQRRKDRPRGQAEEQDRSQPRAGQLLPGTGQQISDQAQQGVERGMAVRLLPRKAKTRPGRRGRRGAFHRESICSGRGRRRSRRSLDQFVIRRSRLPPEPRIGQDPAGAETSRGALSSRPSVYPSSHRIASRGSVKSIKHAVTKPTPKPTRCASIRAFSIPATRGCRLSGPYRVLHVNRPSTSDSSSSSDLGCRQPRCGAGSICLAVDRTNQCGFLAIRK